MASVILSDSTRTVFQSLKSRTFPPEKPSFESSLFSAAVDMAASVPCFILRLSLTGRFWEKIEEVLERCDLRACSVA